MSNEFIDWSGFKAAMERAVSGLIGTKEAIRACQQAFQSLQTAFEGEFPCIAALMVAGTDTWASNLVLMGTVTIRMDSNRLMTSVTQNDKDAKFVIKDEFTEPIAVEVVLLEPETHEIVYRFDKTFNLVAGDEVSLVDSTDAP